MELDYLHSKISGREVLSILHELILKFQSEKKPIGVLCHASSTLCFITENGRSFAQGKNITGFPILWEQLVLSLHQIHSTFLPLPFWTGKKLNTYATGRTLLTKIQEALDLTYVVRDKNIVSGVGPKSGGKLARQLIALI